MELVRQKDPTGCGIAVVAMIAEISYEAAKEVVFANWRRKSDFKTSTRDLIEALARLGYSTSGRLLPVRCGWSGLPSLTIARIRYPWQSERQSHWVLWLMTSKGGRVFCPEGRKPYKRYPNRPVSIIEVFPKT
jgi:ABC-type bacteriocin/lantibiotic exporter with double-glycine peptidase domain